MTKKSRILLITILAAVVAIAASTTVAFALWTGSLNPEANVELTAGQPVTITFGSESDGAINDKIVPGGTVKSVVNMKCTGRDLNVTFKITKVEVKLTGEAEFKDCTSQNFFTITSPSFDGTLTTDAKPVTLEFTMRDNVSSTYVEADFRISVQAVGTIAAAQA